MSRQQLAVEGHAQRIYQAENVGIGRISDDQVTLLQLRDRHCDVVVGKVIACAGLETARRHHLQQLAAAATHPQQRADQGDPVRIGGQSVSAEVLDGGDIELSLTHGREFRRAGKSVEGKRQSDGDARLGG